MSTREEIREKRAKILNLVKTWAVIPHPYGSPDAEGLLYSLSLEGVVIKVDTGDDLTGCCVVRLEPLVEEK